MTDVNCPCATDSGLCRTDCSLGGNRARIGAWADFVYSHGGHVTHVLPHSAGTLGTRLRSAVLCDREPALEWLGTGSQAEQDEARRMPLCVRCEKATRGRVR